MPPLLATYSAWRCLICSTISLQEVYNEDTPPEDATQAMTKLSEAHFPFDLEGVRFCPCNTCTELVRKVPFQTKKDYRKLKKEAKAAGMDPPEQHPPPLEMPSQLVRFVSDTHITTYRGFDNGNLFALEKGEGPFQLESFKVGDLRVKRKHLMKYADKYKDLQWPICSVTSFYLHKAINRIKNEHEPQELLAMSEMNRLKTLESFEKRLEEAQERGVESASDPHFIEQLHKSLSLPSEASLLKARQIQTMPTFPENRDESEEENIQTDGDMTLDEANAHEDEINAPQEETEITEDDYQKLIIGKIFGRDICGPAEPLVGYAGGKVSADYVIGEIREAYSLAPETMGRLIREQPVNARGWIIPWLKDQS